MRYFLLFMFSFTLMHTQTAGAGQVAYSQLPPKAEPSYMNDMVQDEINRYMDQKGSSKQSRERWRSATPQQKIGVCQSANQLCQQNNDKNSCSFFKKECRNKVFE